MPHKLAAKYSGIVVNQNQVVGDPDNDYALGPNGSYRQEFFLPSDYRRGTESGELRYPDLSGIQLLVEVTIGSAPQAAFSYDLEYQVFGLGWVPVTSGVAIGAPTDGTTWLTGYFEEPVEIDQTKATARWRINFECSPYSGTKDLPVEYENGVAVVFGNRVVADLEPYEPWPFEFAGIPSFLYHDPSNDQVYFSYQQGVQKFWFAYPNPLELPFGAKGEDALGAPLTSKPGDVSFCFRVLALAADDGVDFLGNQYRSVVSRNVADNISTALGADRDSFWLSKPNPSKFAVENLYFDVRDNLGAARVVDRVLVDPITPGAYFSVYYSAEDSGFDAIYPSSDSLPSFEFLPYDQTESAKTSESQWESKLWTRVPQTYRMERRETHVLPEPIKAKFLKIEFSHLQARHYAPGNFQQSIRYKKHPKWVLDYFLARVQVNASNPFLSERVAVIYDALDLAYNYYLDDLGQEPSASVDVNNTVLTQVVNFLHDRTDSSDRIDPTTLDKISLLLDTYRQHPALRGVPQTLLGDYARQTVDSNSDYSVEASAPTPIASPDVSSLNRDRVVIEQNYPIMFFYLTCRHAYREVEAKFTHDRAYFAGVRELAFLRDNYMTAFDTSTYIEPAADTLNVERNEFLS